MATGLKRGESSIFRNPQIHAKCGGVPILGYGWTWVLAESPDLTDTARIQSGNDLPRAKAKLKKSWEISKSLIGVGGPRMPYSSEDEYSPLEAIHLIDGNPDTCWSSRSKPHPDAEPEWIRLDLSMEREIRAIKLRKRPPGAPRNQPGSVPLNIGAVEVGMAIPANIEIRVSRDALKWDTVFNGPTGNVPERAGFSCEFTPVIAKQIWIIGSSLPRVENWLYSFSISEVEVCDASGENVALATRGTGVTVSSTQRKSDEQRWLWPIFADMGVKFVRVGYHDDPVNWHRVEKEKGKLIMDPDADSAITWLSKNGIDTVLALGFGNRLYTQPDPTRYLPQLWENYYENPAPPTTKDALEGWKRYVRFVAGHFRGRVRYFEIWNEWNISPYWGAKPDFEHYLAVARAAIPVLREVCPRAKIMNGSTAGFCSGIAKWSPDELARKEKTHPLLVTLAELLPMIDVVGWHAFYQADPDSPLVRDYPADIRAFKRWCESRGFRGSYMCTEWGYGSNYPAAVPPNWWGEFNCTEMEKAKYVARLNVIHVALGVHSFFNEMWTSNYPLDISLLRRSFSADPVTPLQPSAAYYATRNLATFLENVQPASFACKLDGARDEIEVFKMRRKNEKILSFWRPGRAGDSSSAGDRVAIRIRGRFNRVAGYDPINGTAEDLRAEYRGAETVVNDLQVRDYPLFVSFCA